MEISELPNLSGWLTGIPVLIVFISYACFNRGDNWRLGKLICGIGLILVGAHMASLYIELIAYSNIELKKQPSDIALKALHSNSTLWLAVFPAVSIGLGINLISNWIAAMKPDNSEILN